MVNEVLNWFSPADAARFKGSNTKTALNIWATQTQIERARSMIEVWSSETGLDPAEVEMLVERHGMETESILQNRMAKGASSYLQLEALHAIENTMCINLKDFILRRSNLHLTEKNHGLSQLNEITPIFINKFSWTESQLADQIKSAKEAVFHETEWMKG